jgi:SAM-dependent methyltransferase
MPEPYPRAMGFYGEQVVPRLTNVMLGNRSFGKLREETCAGLHGSVIEIGFGSGLNMPHLPPEVTDLWVVEPSETARRLAAKRIDASPVALHEAGLDGGRIDASDDQFDGALSTMTLCTIPDVAGALDELRRVLKPGGTFHFCEHGRAPDARVARRQDRWNPVQNRVAGGCNVNRDMPALLDEAGFEIELLRHFYMTGPKVMGYMSLGRARSA